MIVMLMIGFHALLYYKGNASSSTSHLQVLRCLLRCSNYSYHGRYPIDTSISINFYMLSHKTPKASFETSLVLKVDPGLK